MKCSTTTVAKKSEFLVTSTRLDNYKPRAFGLFQIQIRAWAHNP